jgi:hypothetical protein
VTVYQDRGTIRHDSGLTDDDRMSRCRDHARFHSERRQVTRQPVSATGHVGSTSGIRADTRNSDELLQFANESRLMELGEPKGVREHDASTYANPKFSYT